jgi:deoxyribodipyrimidine photolyase-related protein
MEIRTETDYVAHHIQKVVDLFRNENFSDELNINNHQVIYIKLVDENNLQSFEKKQSLIAKHNFTHFEYQLR